MSAEDPQAYPLNRDSLDSARLSYQHQLLIARQGYYLHPSIVDALSNSQTTTNPTEPIRILDLATGNGIWPIELAESLSKSSLTRSWEILGLDISSNQFPLQATWPTNVSFDNWDLFTDIPDQYLGKFDVVHVRYIIAILWQDDQRATKVLQQLHRLLKPGGFLQWTEPPPPTFDRIIAFNADGSCQVDSQPLKFVQAVDKFFPIQSKSHWINQLDEFVKASGHFTNVQGHWLPLKNERFRYEGDLLIWNCVATLPNILRIPSIPADAKEELEAEFQALSKGLETGTIVVTLRSLTVVGRKL